MLKWNGKGFYPGIPSRDLTSEEVKKYGGVKFLVGLGIYEKPSKRKLKVEKEEIIEEGEKWQDQEH
jgi:hypothetical protein